MNRFIAAAFAAFLLLLIVAPTPAQAFTTTACANGETGTCRLAACGSDVQAAIDASAAGGAGYISPTSFAGDGVYVQNCSSTSRSWGVTGSNKPRPKV